MLQLTMQLYCLLVLKKQAADAVKRRSRNVRSKYYINHRWLGGTLTNWGTIQKRIARLKEIKRMEEDGTFEVLPKKEVALLNKQRARLEKFLGGIEDMPRIPDVMYVVDPHKEQIAVKEAKKLGIPVVAMVDTNTDPDDIDVIIPANDDAIRAVKLITAKLADAIMKDVKVRTQQQLKLNLQLQKLKLTQSKKSLKL